MTDISASAEVTVRRLNAGDDASVLDATHVFDHESVDKNAVRAYLEDPHSHLLIGYVDGRPAGFVRAAEILRLDTTRRQMFLYELGVNEEFRRLGVATAMIRELETICRQQSFLEMFVITNESNLPAVRLYESTGGVRGTDDDVVYVYLYDD